MGEHTTAADNTAATELNAMLTEMGKAALRVVGEASVRKPGANIVYIGTPQSAFAKRWLKGRKFQPGPDLREEGYILDVSDDAVVILGESARGRYYGVMTLLQLMEQRKKSIVVPGIAIRDWPREGIRGITDDLSRGQVSTMENFKKIIRFLSRHKLNVYSPYMEDMFVFKSHPLIGKGRGALTAADVRELDAYAKQHHVQVIPIFETLGHWENILALPEYARFAEFPGAHTVNVSDEAVYTILDEMISELSVAFSSPYFNIAADESWDVGLGANKARVAASDLANVHAEHYKRLFDTLKKYKKKPMMYGDIILNNPTILEKIPKNVIIVDWHYGAQEEYSSPATFRNAGFPFVVSPAVWNFTGPFPNYINTMVNVQNLNRDGFRNGSLGLLTSNWNDNGGEALRELNYYGYAWTAECAWRPLEADIVRFDEVFFRQYFGSDQAALHGQTAYALLASPMNQVNWQELWRHPMLPQRPSPISLIQRVESIASTMPVVAQSAAGLTAQARENTGEPRILAFVGRLVHWFGRKVSVAEEIKRIAADTSHIGGEDSLVQSSVANAREVITGLQQLKSEFQSLWLESNQSANLQYLLMRYDRQIEYWEELIRSLELKGTPDDPLIASQWIYHAEAHPGMRDSSLSQVPKAYFRSVLSLTQPASNAKVQLLADTRARLWINGVELGEVSARRSLSLIVEHQRVKMWDIRPLLHPGDNIIAVEAENYGTFGSAGINVCGELQTGDTTFSILTDSTWSVTREVSEGWKTDRTGNGTWTAAAGKTYPFAVVKPDFESGRLSWIER